MSFFDVETDRLAGGLAFKAAYRPDGIKELQMTSTFVAGLRHDGIIAPMVMNGPMNGLIFQIYARGRLAPEPRPGDTVIMGNLQSHKGQVIKETVAERGTRLLFLPPYSPDLNPIENFFSKLKTLLKAAEERTRDELWNRIGKILE